mgnify:CR=1 FL=1
MDFKNKKILAIIPARSGSKSIKDKNITLYKGKPLIYHSIKTALKSKLIDKVIVSTDSKKYKRISLNYGAEVPFLRPKKFSLDFSLDYDFILHATKYMMKYNYNPDLTSSGLLKNPATNFGAITRSISNDTDFDRTNVQYIEFWMMDPFIDGDNGKVLDGIFNNNNTTGGKLIFNCLLYTSPSPRDA